MRASTSGLPRYFARFVSPALAASLAAVLRQPRRRALHPLLHRAVRTDDDGEERYMLANPALPGMHNRGNMCAAIECSGIAGDGDG